MQQLKIILIREGSCSDASLKSPKALNAGQAGADTSVRNRINPPPTLVYELFKRRKNPKIRSKTKTFQRSRYKNGFELKTSLLKFIAAVCIIALYITRHNRIKVKNVLNSACLLSQTVCIIWPDLFHRHSYFLLLFSKLHFVHKFFQKLEMKHLPLDWKNKKKEYQKN